MSLLKVNSSWLTLCGSCTLLLFTRNLRRLASSLPITKPRRILKREVTKINKAKQTGQYVNREATDSPLIISCKRKEYNHYRANSYGIKAGEPVPLKFLSSGGWLHYKSKGDYFTINPHAKVDTVDRGTTFQELGLAEMIINQLSKQKITHPSHIQVEAIPEILELSNVICAAETGCGKTYAYLLPILQKLHQYKQSVSESDLPPANITSPRAVILVPSRELADQLQNVAERFSDSLQLNILNMSQGSQTSRLVRSLRCKVRDVDLLVSTPGSLSIALRANAIDGKRVNHVVIDEADTLMDNSFNKTTVYLLRQLAAKETGILGLQLILASATLPKDLKNILKHTVNTDGFVKCFTSNLHHVLAHVSQKFIRIDHRHKTDWLVNQLNLTADLPTIVFANSCATASFISNLLTEKQIDSVLLHGEVESQERLSRYKAFQEGACNVLVCSDVASRGLDTHNVKQVINYNMPRFISDYIHRAGRVGRLSSQASGKVLSLIGHRPEVDLVWQIEGSVRSNKAVAELPNVNANIKKHLTNIARSVI